MGFHKFLRAGVVACVLASPGIALARSPKATSVRLTIQSTRTYGSATVHDGASAPLGGASVQLTLTPGKENAAFALTSADGKTLYHLTVADFLTDGGTWILPGSAVGSPASSVALAIYPEGPGAGHSHKSKSSDYARIKAFTPKAGTKTETVGLNTKPLAVGHTTFAASTFYSSKSCAILVTGPQFPGASFNLGNGGQTVLASPNGKQAFLATASHYRS